MRVSTSYNKWIGINLFIVHGAKWNLVMIKARCTGEDCAKCFHFWWTFTEAHTSRHLAVCVFRKKKSLELPHWMLKCSPCDPFCQIPVLSSSALDQMITFVNCRLPRIQFNVAIHGQGWKLLIVMNNRYPIGLFCGDAPVSRNSYGQTCGKPS